MYKKNFVLFTYLIFILASQKCLAIFSFKDVSSWVLGYKQETLHKEIPCDHECTLCIENNSGSIYIKTWPLPKIAIQGIKSAREKDLDNILINTLIEDSTIIIKTNYDDKKVKGDVDYYIIVPAHLNLKLATQSGSIKIKNIKGIIEAKVNAGSIEVNQAENSLFLKNLYGSIIINMKELSPTTHLVAEASNQLNLYLPTITNADIYAKAPFGTITSEHYLTLKPVTTKLNPHAWSSFKKEIQATLGQGGSQINLISTHGNIKILEY